MVAIHHAPANRFETVLAGLLQQEIRVTGPQKNMLAAVSVNPVADANPSGEPEQVEDANGLMRFEYMKGILLITFMFSVLVLETQIVGQF